MWIHSGLSRYFIIGLTTCLPRKVSAHLLVLSVKENVGGYVGSELKKSIPLGMLGVGFILGDAMYAKRLVEPAPYDGGVFR